MIKAPLFRFLFIATGCFLLLTSCLQVKDTKGALSAIVADPRVEGDWHILKWMEEEKTPGSIKADDPADVNLTKIERNGHTGYKFTAKNPDIQKDVESLWAMNFEETRFLLSAFPEGDCAGCTLLHYNVTEDQITAFILKIKEAQVYLKEKYPDNSKIVSNNADEFVKEISVHVLDDEGKTILKELAQQPDLWETAVILKKKRQ